MRRLLRARLLASAVVLCVIPFAAAGVPAEAQARLDISFDSFHDQLARYGDWVYSDRWGLVWQPANVPDDFRPYYSGGRWAYTSAYGWTWASDYDWGDIAFHYGRWVDDPYDGWMWLPGYTWSPGWVIWRSNTRSVGWMAMPPDNQFLGNRNDDYFAMSFGGVSVNWNDTSGNYGYSRWYGRDYDQRRFAANWTFVDTGHMADRDYRGVAYAPDRAITSIRQTTNITNYKIVNNYMVNSSVDVRTVERASGHPIAVAAPAAIFKHPNSVITIDTGQKARAREFDRAPHGTGLANSAPQPPAAVINKLSDRVTAPHAGGIGSAGPRAASGPSHLFTKSTITTPAAASQFHGNLRPGAMGAMPANPPPPPAGSPASHPVPAAALPKPVSGTMMGPGRGDTTSVPGGMHDRHMGGPNAATSPATAPVSPGPKPFEHKPSAAMTGPMTAPVAKPIEHAASPPAAGSRLPPAGPQALHPVPAPAVAKPVPNTMMGPGGRDTTSMPGGMRDRHMGGPNAATGPAGAPVPPGPKPFEHQPAAAGPMTGPGARPLQPKMLQPKMMQPAPVAHNPPSAKPRDVPKKDEPKDEHAKPN